MLSFAAREVVHLGATGFQGSSVLATNAEEHEFGNISKVETNPSPVGSAILADFVPNDIAFVSEAPCVHNLNAKRQQCVRHPQIKMARFIGRLRPKAVMHSEGLADSLLRQSFDKYCSRPRGAPL